MENPGLVTMFSKIRIDLKYKVYCEYMNRIIRGIIREKGNSTRFRVSCDKLYYYEDGKLRFRIERYKSLFDLGFTWNSGISFSIRSRWRNASFECSRRMGKRNTGIRV